MAYRNFLCLPALVALLVTGSATLALAAEAYRSLPPACLPERAIKWNASKPQEYLQAACHCPPPSMCPRTREEYEDDNRAKMPSDFIIKCCAEPPIPPDPPSDRCEAKWYPTLRQSGMDTGSGFNGFGGVTGAASKYFAHTFEAAVGDEDTGVGFVAFSWLPTKNRFSVRTVSLDLWQFAPYVIPGYTTINPSLQPGSFNQQTRAADGLRGEEGIDNQTWFGVWQGTINKLPNNLVNDGLKAELARDPKTAIEIQQLSLEGGMSDTEDTYNLRTHAPSFYSLCLSVGGEYVSIEKDPDQRGCNYLQCRHIYSGDRGESCVAKGTKVTLADGTTKPIEEVKVGDALKASSGEQRVTAMNHYTSGLRVFYGINGDVLKLTGDHPILTADGYKVVGDAGAKLYAGKPGFAKDVQLKVGDKVTKDDGTTLEVTSIKRLPQVDAVDTFNLKTDGDNSFFANGLSVKGFDQMEIKYQ